MIRCSGEAAEHISSHREYFRAASSNPLSEFTSDDVLMHLLPPPHDPRPLLLGRAGSDQRTLLDRLVMSNYEHWCPPTLVNHRQTDQTAVGEAILQVSTHFCLQLLLSWLRCSCSVSFAHDGRLHLLGLCSVSVLLQPPFQHHPRAIATRIAAPASALHLSSDSAPAAAISSPSAHPAARCGRLLLTPLLYKRSTSSMPSFPTLPSAVVDPSSVDLEQQRSP